MTDATSGSAQAGAPPAPAGNGGEGSPAAPVDPFAGLETGTREWLGTKGYKSVGDLAAAARSAESLIGSSVRVPGADAKPEDWEKFYGKLGRPEKADGYDFKMPDGLPEGFAYDGELAKGFKAAAHAAGLNPKQAQAAHDFWVQTAAAGMQKQAEAKAAAEVEQAKAATAAMEKEFGGQFGSDAFKRANQLMETAMGDLGGPELVAALKARGLIAADGLILDGAIATAFYKAGKALYQEGGIDTAGGGAAGADNPFVGDRDKLNWTMIHTIVRTDRPRALSLIRAAGKQPKDFGLNEAA